MTMQLAVQMYTIRDFVKTGSGFAESLDKIKKMGYYAVQLSAVGAMEGEKPEISAKEARKMLDDHGIKCIATHIGWHALQHEIDREIETHQILGCDFTAIGSIPGSYGEKGAEGYSQFVRDADPIIARLKAAGIRFGYHNHAFEFLRIGPGRKTLFDLFIEAENPDFLLEQDVYWTDHAGVNPVRIFERAPGRQPVIHVKDKEIDENGQPVMAPIGEGNLDWEGLLPACDTAGVEWLCIEQDTCRRDPFDCLRSSFEFLTPMLAKSA